MMSGPLSLVPLLRSRSFALSLSRSLRLALQFGFIYQGYHTDRGPVVSWESFVMLRKLTVTAITVSSSDPYIQIFVALLLLIISYGMQERFKPYESPMLNNIESLGLFSLIFTQIVSILYLYIDTRAAATGTRDKMLEYGVTAVLMGANIAIALAMGIGYAISWAQHCRVSNREYARFIEERDLPFGEITKYANPYVGPGKRFAIFKALEDCPVYLKPMLSNSEKTGEIAEKGDEVPMLISEKTDEYIRPRSCCGHRKARHATWMKRADGTGW